MSQSYTLTIKDADGTPFFTGQYGWDESEEFEDLASVGNVILKEAEKIIKKGGKVGKIQAENDTTGRVYTVVEDLNDENVRENISGDLPNFFTWNQGKNWFILSPDEGMIPGDEHFTGEAPSVEKPKERLLGPGGLPPKNLQGLEGQQPIEEQPKPKNSRLKGLVKETLLDVVNPISRTKGILAQSRTGRRRMNTFQKFTHNRVKANMNTNSSQGFKRLYKNARPEAKMYSKKIMNHMKRQAEPPSIKALRWAVKRK